MNINKRFGFTLVELLVVMSIMGILTVVLASSFVNSQERSRDAARKANLKSLSDALNMYYADNGKYPAEITFGDEFKDKNIIYMKKLPLEKSNKRKPFIYKVSTDEKSFKLFSNLENKEDSDCMSCLSSEYNINDIGCCYAITSSNIGVTDVIN